MRLASHLESGGGGYSVGGHMTSIALQIIVIALNATLSMILQLSVSYIMDTVDSCLLAV